MKQPKLTICIVHYRKLKQLKKTIESLEHNTNTEYFLRIFNNGYIGDKKVISYLKKLHRENRHIEVKFNPENIGCSPARRLITQGIKTPFIMMLDDDMYVNKNWDKPIWEAFEKDPKLGAVGFSIYKTNGEFWWLGGRNIEINGKVVNTSRPKVCPETYRKEFVQTDDVAAGAMVYRRELQQVFEWNPGYFIGFEDLEKGVALKRSNYKCAVSVKSKFVHDKVSLNPKAKKYNRSRRDYKAYRSSYLNFMRRNKLKLPLTRHIFYKYVCLLPNSILQPIAYKWLAIKNE